MSSKKKKRSWMSRHPRAKKIAYSFYGILIACVFVLIIPVFILPKRWVYVIGRCIGLCTWRAIRKKTKKNLFYAYGDRMSEKRANAITKKVSIHVVWFIVDLYYMWVFARGYDAREIVTHVYNWNEFEDAYKKGKGMFMATIHFSCFEVLPVYFRHATDTEGGVIARSFPSPFMTWMYRKVRMRQNVPTYYDEIRNVVRHLRQNCLIGILPDLRAKRRLGVPCTFFGKPTLAFDIQWRVAAQTGSSIMPCFMVRHCKEPWKYILILQSAIYITRKASDEERAEKVQELNDVFEQHIRYFPSNWFWFHNKWKI